MGSSRPEKVWKYKSQVYHWMQKSLNAFANTNLYVGLHNWAASLGCLCIFPSILYSLTETSAKTHDQQFAQELRSEERQCENSSPRPAEGISIAELGERSLGRARELWRTVAMKREGINSSHCAWEQEWGWSYRKRLRVQNKPLTSSS